MFVLYSIHFPAPNWQNIFSSTKPFVQFHYNVVYLVHFKKYNLQYVGSIRFTNQKFITCSQFQVTQDKGYTPWAFGLRFVRQVRWLFELLRRFVKNCPRIQKVHLLLTCIGRLDHGAAYKLLCLLVLYLSCLVANGPYFRPFTSQKGPKPMATFEPFENNLFFLVKCL